MKKILIIGDTGKFADTIENVLAPPDFNIFYSHDQKDGFNIASRYSPDLILFCCNSGIKELNDIKKFSSDDTLAVIPLIVIAENFSFEEQRAAMELGADDYIPSAYLKSTLHNSIEKRFKKLSLLKQSIYDAVNSLDEQDTLKEKNDHILIKLGNKIKLVEFSEIICITALKEYSKIFTTDNCKIIVRKSLKAWIKLLPAKSFIRIHRATIININYIEEITKSNTRTYTVHLKSLKESFDFSYRYANLMRRTFPS